MYLYIYLYERERESKQGWEEGPWEKGEKES